jgi:hypothetical protein
MSNYYRVMLCEAKVLLKADSEDEAKQIALDHFKRTLMVEDLIAWEEASHEPQEAKGSSGAISWT